MGEWHLRWRIWWWRSTHATHRVGGAGGHADGALRLVSAADAAGVDAEGGGPVGGAHSVAAHAHLAHLAHRPRKALGAVGARRTLVACTKRRKSDLKESNRVDPGQPVALHTYCSAHLLPCTPIALHTLKNGCPLCRIDFNLEFNMNIGFGDQRNMTTVLGEKNGLSTAKHKRTDNHWEWQ